MHLRNGHAVAHDGRASFTVHVQPRLMVDAFAAAAKTRTCFSDWLEQAIAARLAMPSFGLSVTPELVARFCDIAERDVELLPPRWRRMYTRLCGDWDRYWMTPRVTVGQLEEGTLPECAQRPCLNRRRVADDWQHLLRDDKRDLARVDGRD